MKEVQTFHKGRVCKKWLDWIYNNPSVEKHIDSWRLKICPFCGEMLD